MATSDGPWLGRRVRTGLSICIYSRTFQGVVAWDVFLFELHTHVDSSYDFDPVPHGCYNPMVRPAEQLRSRFAFIRCVRYSASSGGEAQKRVRGPNAGGTGQRTPSWRSNPKESVRSARHWHLVVCGSVAFLQVTRNLWTKGRNLFDLCQNLIAHQLDKIAKTEQMLAHQTKTQDLP